MRKPVRTLALLSVAALAAGMGLSGSANAAQAGDPEILAKNLAAPLSLPSPRTARPTSPPTSRACSSRRRGRRRRRIIYHGQARRAPRSAGCPAAGTAHVHDHRQEPRWSTQIEKGKVAARSPTSASTRRTRTPTPDVTYGFKGISDKCAAQCPRRSAPPTTPASSTRTPTPPTDRQRHLRRPTPPATTSCRSHDGEIKIVAVLPADPGQGSPPRPPTRSGLPALRVGLYYWFEPVPTDVEIGPDGWLYVCSLPGGPEDGSLGAQGRVYKVNPEVRQGDARRRRLHQHRRRGGRRATVTSTWPSSSPARSSGSRRARSKVKTFARLTHAGRDSSGPRTASTRRTTRSSGPEEPEGQGRPYQL